jgi:hypothetical protein
VSNAAGSYFEATIKPAVDYRSELYIKKITEQANEAPTYSYSFNGPEGAPVNGVDAVEEVIALWKEFELLTIEDICASKDAKSRRNMKLVR